MKVPSMERKGLFWLVGLVMVWIMAGCGADSAFDDRINWRSALTVVVDPYDGEDNVSTTRPIIATFNKEIVSALINENYFFLEDAAGHRVDGTLTYHNKVVTFTPDEELDEYSDYVFTIKWDVTSTEGVQLGSPGNDTITHFTTGGPSQYLYVSISPPDNAANVEINPEIKATFSDAIDTATLSSATFYLEKFGDPTHTKIAMKTPGIEYYAPTKMASFELADDLEAFTKYTVHVTTSVLSTTGLYLEHEATATFETGDWKRFTVRFIEPTDGATNVSRTTPIEAEFSGPVDEATLNSATAYLEDVNGSNPGAHISGTWIKPLPNGTDFIFTLAQPLEPFTTYKFVFKKTVAALDGETLGDDNEMTFTTGNWTDFRVVYVKPHDGEDNVSISTEVKAWFNYTADATSLTDTNVYLTYGGMNTVLGAINYIEGGGSHVVVFDPNDFLDANTTYTFTIKQDVNSTLGDHLASDHVTEFMTGDFIPPEPLFAVFSLAPTAATVDTSKSDLLGGLVGGLLGVQAQVDAVGVQGLAEIDLSTSDFLSLLSGESGETNVGDLLNSNMPLADMLALIAEQLGGVGASDAQQVVYNLLDQVNSSGTGSTPVTIGELFQFPVSMLPLSVDQLQSLGGAGQFNSLSLLTALNNALMPILANPIDIPLGDVLGLTDPNSGLRLQVVTPPTVAQIMQVGDTIHSSTTRLQLRLGVGGLLGDLVTQLTTGLSDANLSDQNVSNNLIDLPLYLELGSAEANLTELSDENITMDVRNGLARLYIGTIPDDLFFTQERLDPDDFDAVKLVNLPNILVISIKGYAVGEAEATRISFLPVDVEQVGSAFAPAGSDVGSLLNSLVADLDVNISLLDGSLDALLNPLLDDLISQVVSPLISVLVPVLSPLLNSVSDLLGLYAGRADVTMSSIIYSSAQ